MLANSWANSPIGKLVTVIEGKLSELVQPDSSATEPPLYWYSLCHRSIARYKLKISLNSNHASVFFDFWIAWIIV